MVWFSLSIIMIQEFAVYLYSSHGSPQQNYFVVDSALSNTGKFVLAFIFFGRRRLKEV